MKFILFKTCLLVLVICSNLVEVKAQDEFIVIPDTSVHRTDAETEIPITIRVSKYEIGKTEVTQSQFEKVMGYNNSFYKGKDRPVEEVSWWECLQYCNNRSIQEGLEPCYDLTTGECDFSRNGYRLPTNTEWTIASGNDEKDTHAVGNFGNNDRSDIKQLDKELLKGTSLIAQYKPNELGLYDMMGNVWEWCYDWNDDVHQAVPLSLNNPTGISWGVARMLRGGSFVNPSDFKWKQVVTSMVPEYTSRFTGFRLARSIGSRQIQNEIKDISTWYGQFNQEPEEYKGHLGPLTSLISNDRGERTASISEWETRKEKIMDKWSELLGKPSFDSLTGVNVKVVKIIDEDIYWGKIMYLQVEPDYWEKIYLMIPKNPIRTPTPVIITPYYDIDTPAGRNLGGRAFSSKDVRHYSYLAVQHGYIALAIRWFGEGYGEGDNESSAILHMRHPDWTGMGKWVWDSRRAVDYLYTLPFVDKENIGLIGHSLGAKLGLYSAAFDERISAVALSDGGIGFSFSNYADYWYFGNYLREIQDETDQDELLGLVAPRSFLLIGGEYDNNKSWYYINSGREVYDLYGKKENIGFINHATGHAPTPRSLSLAFEWFDHYLKN